MCIKCVIVGYFHSRNILHSLAKVTVCLYFGAVMHIIAVLHYIESDYNR